jgi:hypothetical protein
MYFNIFQCISIYFNVFQYISYVFIVYLNIYRLIDILTVYLNVCKCNHSVFKYI